MEIRKIQKTGVSTMTVSLPKKWVVERGLRQGDPLEMQILMDGSLSLNSVQGDKEELMRKVVEVNEGEIGAHIIRKLIAAYLAGFNIIEVRAKGRLDLSIKKEVKEFSRLAIGPEVIDETANTLVLHDLSDPAELPQRKCVRRMHRLASSMHRDAMTSFETGDEELARDVIDRDLDVDRLYLMVVKQYNLVLKDRRISAKIGVDVFDGMNLMLAARLIERIGDHAEKIAKMSIGRSDGKIEEKLLQALKDLSERMILLLDRAVESLFKKDVTEANSVIDTGEEIVRDCESLKPRIESHLCGVVENTVLDSVLRSSMYAIDIAETAINMAVSSE